MSLTIDFTSVEAKIERFARRGGEVAAAHALERIRKHAPVRKIFRGTTYKTGKSGFREPVSRRVRFDGDQRSGHANSAVPLFRTKTASGTAFISGDFRRVNTTTRRLREIGTGARASTIGEPSTAAYGRYKPTQHVVDGSTSSGSLTLVNVVGGKAKLANPAKVKPISAENLKTGAGKVLTTRGRYDVRSGRADYKSNGATRVGGRLRGELHVEGPVDEDGILWWYVVSATKDPQSGRLYGLDQEFGTKRHKPHPFMRPGLHESRGALRRSVKSAIKEGLRSR